MRQDSDYKIVSYYTPDYTKHAEGLIASIEKQLPDQEYEIEPISQRSWVKATCLKGSFMRDKIATSKKAVVWIDADAVVTQPNLEFPKVDFAIFARFAHTIRNTWSPFRTGTIYFGRSPAALDLAEIWAQECKMQQDGIDQWALFRAWLKKMNDNHRPSTVWLPLPYCQKIG